MILGKPDLIRQKLSKQGMVLSWWEHGRDGLEEANGRLWNA